MTTGQVRRLHFTKNSRVCLIIGIAYIGSLFTGCGNGATDLLEGSPDSSEGSVVFQDGEFEIVEGGPIVLDTELSDTVTRAVGRYSVSPDVETCSELAEWYVNGLEIAFQGELIELIENDADVDTILQVIGQVRSALNDQMIESLKRDSSLCPRNETFSTEGIIIPELKPVTQRTLSLLERHGGSTSLEGSTALKATITIAEGRELIFEIERFSDDQE